MLNKKLYHLLLAPIIFLGLVGSLPAMAKGDSDYQTLDWVDLMPESDYLALTTPPDYITEAVDGADIFSDPAASASVIEFGDEFSMPSPLDDPYQQALVSTKIIPEMDGKAVRLPGFIVPLEFDDDLTVTEFFLVPYFGACIHLPPPPPNQMVFVTYPEGIKIDVLYDPFWISGVLEAEVSRNELGTSAYSMQMEKFEVYSE